MQKTVVVNEAGLRIGEDHPNAKLTNGEVETLRQLHEEDGLSYKALAEKFELSKGAVAKICRYERRGQYPADFKTVPVPDCE
jgi:DNA-binding MarR family transcriptional regulator